MTEGKRKTGMRKRKKMVKKEGMNRQMNKKNRNSERIYEIEKAMKRISGTNERMNGKKEGRKEENNKEKRKLRGK